VIPNGIELAAYGQPLDRTAYRATLGVGPTDTLLACVARFHPVKDHAMLIRAFARIAPQFPQAKLLLAGEGPLRESLEQQVAQAGIAEQVRFLGVRRDVPQLLAAVDAFALTSVSEAASLTVLEAMASRLPVVVTAVGGNPEMVRDGIDGDLVPRGDDAACAEALARLLADPALGRKRGEAGRERVEERYRLADTIERYHQLYRRLAGQLASPPRSEDAP
jgi:glycosyltransferase involved in cell wall biosynthesis